MQHSIIYDRSTDTSNNKVHNHNIGVQNVPNNIIFVLNEAHWTKSHQLSTTCRPTAMIPVTLLQSTLRSSNLFQKASVPNGRRSSNFGRVAAQFYFLPLINSKTTRPIFSIFTRCRAISVAINARIHKAMVHSVSERENTEWRRRFWRLQKASKIDRSP